MRRLFLLAAAALWGGLWLPPLRAALERDMAVHMVVQLPLLAGVGLLLAPVLAQYQPRWLVAGDWLGIPGLVLVVFATSVWMLPRMLDAALAGWPFDLVKFLSLPLSVGLPLGLSWARMPGLGRAFVWANFIPKLGAIGGLYLAAPTRLCAYYRLDQQTVAGWALIAAALALGMLWFLAALIGWTPSAAARRSAGRQTKPAARLPPATLVGSLGNR
ncbi:MAG: hypothetical protein ACREE2_09460 [Stellaceae bacterium]